MFSLEADPEPVERRRSSRARNISKSSPANPDYLDSNISPKSASEHVPFAENAESTAGPIRSSAKRKPKTNVPGAAMEEAMKPLTDEERQNWKGWIELESEPVGLLMPFTPLSFTFQVSYNPRRTSSHLITKSVGPFQLYPAQLWGQGGQSPGSF